MKQIVEKNEDGTVIAYEDGALFTGTPIRVGYDELTVAIEETETEIRRVTSFGEHVVSNELVNKSSTPPGVEELIRQWEIDNPNEDSTPIRDNLRNAWLEEMRNETITKQYRTVLDMEGNDVTQEVAFNFYTWEAMV